MKALLVIDVQNDFCAGGALEVPDANAIIAPINSLINNHPVVIFTADHHPKGHHSFASTHKVPAFSTIELDDGPQPAWPDHCIAGSHGAQFHPQLNTTLARCIVRKGMKQRVDSYSGFFDNDRTSPTGLHGILQELGVTEVVCVGLAYDFCVSWTALDARRLGYEVTVHRAATRAIASKSAQEATTKMLDAKIILA